MGRFIRIGSDKSKRLLLCLSVFVCVGLLVYFKYLNFFIDSFAALFNKIGFCSSLSTFKIIIPLGISIYSFKGLSYLIDMKNEKYDYCNNFIQFASYISYFPTITSGPIDRASFFLPQLEKIRKFDYEKAIDGCWQVLWGLLKKMVVADNLSVIVDNTWDSYQTMNSAVLILASIAYSIQIYADFSGYSDMVIGVSKILNINVSPNFRYPYFSRNISEFWRHWHMSLTNWFTDYVYIPLGGNRRSKSRTVVNTLIVFTLCGLWHGSNWTYVVWGFYNGLLFIPLIINDSIKKKWKNQPLLFDWSNIKSFLMTFVLITIGWIFFRADSIQDAFCYIHRLLINWNNPIRMKTEFVYILFGVVLIIYEWINRQYEFSLQSLFDKKLCRGYFRVVVFALLFWLLLFFAGSPVKFIYAQF